MTTILFVFSLFGICALLGAKVFELKVRKIDLLSQMFERGDRGIHQFIDRAVLEYNRSKKIAYLFVFEFLPSYLYEVLVQMKDFVAKKYYSMGSGFDGRRMLRSTGSVSFFLERLAEDRVKNQ
jgi:hypothetical protein